MEITNMHKMSNYRFLLKQNIQYFIIFVNKRNKGGIIKSIGFVLAVQNRQKPFQHIDHYYDMGNIYCTITQQENQKRHKKAMHR